MSAQAVVSRILAGGGKWVSMSRLRKASTSPADAMAAYRLAARCGIEVRGKPNYAEYQTEIVEFRRSYR